MPLSVYLFLCKHIGIEKKDVIPWYKFYQNFAQFEFHFKAWITFWSTPVFNSRLYFLTCTMFCHKIFKFAKKNTRQTVEKT